jgi:hypothetical protein
VRQAVPAAPAGLLLLVAVLAFLLVTILVVIATGGCLQRRQKARDDPAERRAPGTEAAYKIIEPASVQGGSSPRSSGKQQV